jgi:hypothetical protein
MMYLSSTLLNYPSPETFNVKYSDLLALDEIEALHFKYDYTSLHVYIPLKAYLEQTKRWVYDGNGRWSTSDRMVRLRSDGDKFRLEVWVISGDVHRIHELDIDDTGLLITQLRKLGI